MFGLNRRSTSNLYRVLRGIAMNGSLCVSYRELLCVGPCLLGRWFLWCLTVYRRRTKNTFLFQASATSIVRDPQDLEKKSAWFSKFGSGIAISRCMCWHISEKVCVSWHSSGKSSREIPSTSLRILHAFNAATSSRFSWFFDSFE